MLILEEITKKLEEAAQFGFNYVPAESGRTDIMIQRFEDFAVLAGKQNVGNMYYSTSMITEDMVEALAFNQERLAHLPESYVESIHYELSLYEGNLNEIRKLVGSLYELEFFYVCQGVIYSHYVGVDFDIPDPAGYLDALVQRDQHKLEAYGE
ncbi:hypothetical protein [Paenibacillus sp. QZ-Y1]|uniref:hypothetical protein n=1 Tax=Paenibacillus sp. QZ-Y1 TaxID=3414511 RepID=UPI003F7A870C